MVCIFHIGARFDPVWCRKESAAFAARAGFDKAAQWEIAIAVSELVTNVVKYAGQGTLTLRRLDDNGRGIEIVVEDDGPGITDLESAMKDGYSEGRMLCADDVPSHGRGLGTGLGAVRRMMDGVSMENRAEGGLRVVAVKWASAR
ncbi:MAG: ATP-binding protein [Deltaproteobacteria bacterium]|nr:ATP-binding protein [Deltaproteobacteria bacterium]